MKKILPIFILMLFPGLIFAQEEKPNAAELIKITINEQGLEKAQTKFLEILSDTSQFTLRESELNTLGYSYVYQRKNEEAIAVLKMNIKAFPDSWNVYDSMGEIYTWTGNTKDAIKNFNKSLELNPDNENALKNLSFINGTKADHENETKAKFQYSNGEATGINKAYFGEEPPGLTPKIFAPGLISTRGNFEFACTFSPDGKEFYFTRRNDKGANVIMVSKWENSGWTAPDTAAFSHPGDHEPHVTPDGKKLYFGTTRIKPGADNPAYGIWVMNKTGSEWSTPEYAADGMYASATRNGSLYLTDIEGLTDGGIIKLYLNNGVFGNPERLKGGVNHPVNGIHPFIEPNEAFLLFDCYRKDGFGGEGDIYVSFRAADGNWTEAINLGAEVNGPGVEFCASISPDGKYIFYTKNRDIYWVSSKILDF
jgi:hypothetical protein